MRHAKRRRRRQRERIIVMASVEVCVCALLWCVCCFRQQADLLLALSLITTNHSHFTIGHIHLLHTQYVQRGLSHSLSVLPIARLSVTLTLRTLGESDSQSESESSCSRAIMIICLAFILSCSTLCSALLSVLPLLLRLISDCVSCVTCRHNSSPINRPPLPLQPPLLVLSGNK